MLRSKIIHTFSAIGLAFGISLASTAQADYPEKDIRLILPFGPGGATDILFRLISKEAEKHLGVSIVPVNMAGAGATIGSREVKDAEPDGYTLLGSHESIALSNLAGIVDYSYDAFEPIALLTQTVLIPITYPSHPVQNAGEIAQYIEESPEKVRFSMIPTSTDHFFWVQMLNAIDVDISDVNLISYPDSAEQMSAIIAEEIDFTITGLPAGSPFFESDTVRPLGVAHAERLNGLEEVPTLYEFGINMENAASRGLFAPLGTPDERINIIADAYRKAMENEEIQKKISEEFGSEPRFLSGDDYQKFLIENESKLAETAKHIDFDD